MTSSEREKIESTLTVSLSPFDLQYRKKATPPPSAGELPQTYIDSHGVEHAFAEQAPLLSEMDEPMREMIASIETTTPLSSKSDFIVKHVKSV